MYAVLGIRIFIRRRDINTRFDFLKDVRKCKKFGKKETKKQRKKKKKNKETKIGIE